eukprot:GGOE01036334.1.p1 GENE.GGOE01036334.1~~GGOE01036334.1.p1  ORF type:complete len:265 (+),score=21.10 GGOE01036334.1:38-796(+)
MASAKARKGKARALVDISQTVPNAEVGAVYRIRTDAEPSKPPQWSDDDEEKAPKSLSQPQPPPAKAKKRKSGGQPNFLEEKRKLKARKREERTVLPQVQATTSSFEHMKVMCDPVGIISSLLKEEFPDAMTVEVAERMQCAWLKFQTSDSASKAANGAHHLAGVSVQATKSKRSTEEVFVSLQGRKVLGAFVDRHFPGVKDVVEATDNCVRARFLTKDAAKAAVKKGALTAFNTFVLAVTGPWGSDTPLPDF